MGSFWSSLRSIYANTIISRLLDNSSGLRLGDKNVDGHSKSDKMRSDNDHDHGHEPTMRDTCDIAIIGGGIIGIIVALGLVHRGIKVKVYERASKFTETSAGFSFSAGAREAMRAVAPTVAAALERVAAPNQHPYIRYFDGFTPSVDAPQWRIPAERPDYHGCLRAAFLESLGNALPEGVVAFGKSLETYEDEKDGEKVVLRFTDGTVAEVDAVIGCDGIKSRTRRIMLGENNPAASPGFVQMVAYRAVVPIEGALAALGKDKAYSHCLNVGPGAYTVTYPVANDTLTNLILFCKEPGPWPDSGRLLETCRRENAQRAVQSWKPEVRALIDLLPENPSKWAMFDMSDHPASTYTSGRVCVAGDAAHASTPFLASGAAMGVEDAAVLTTTLDTALKRTASNSATDKAAAITAAFQAFSTIRIERSQRVVTDSRAVGDICLWQNPETGQDADKCYAGIWSRYCHVWEFDVGDMIQRARRECERLLASSDDA